jgi:hypothetical protein
MFNAAEIEELAARKRLLATESDLNRQALRMEMERVRASAAKVEKIFRFGRSAYPVVLAASPLAGYFFASKAGPAKGILKSALWGWQIVRRLKPFWDKWRTSKSSAESPPEAEYR